MRCVQCDSLSSNWTPIYCSISVETFTRSSYWTEFFVVRLEFVGLVVGYVLHIVHLESVSDILVYLCVPASNDMSWIMLKVDVQSRVHMTYKWEESHQVPLWFWRRMVLWKFRDLWRCQLKMRQKLGNSNLKWKSCSLTLITHWIKSASSLMRLFSSVASWTEPKFQTNSQCYTHWQTQALQDSDENALGNVHLAMLLIIEVLDWRFVMTTWGLSIWACSYYNAQWKVMLASPCRCQAGPIVCSQFTLNNIQESGHCRMW